jgi:tRNA nucleotidyltransferase (CCA-adding enzyme)
MDPRFEQLTVPRIVDDIAHRCQEAGGRALLVGGCVRDPLLGIAIKDWDLEVHGLDADALERALSTTGRVNGVGRAFQVFKVRRGDLEIDVSIPRRDSKQGAGHKGILAIGAPDIGLVEASRRRDLTINAMMVDLITRELIDPWGGLQHLEQGVLHPVDRDTFLEDPLRAVRVIQFAARFGFRASDLLVDLCREADLHELPAERIQIEWGKLFTRGKRPSLGLQVARRAQMLSRLFPELVDAPALDAALDAAVALRDDEMVDAPEGRKLALMLAVWLDACTPAAAEATLDRLQLHRWLGFPTRDAVLAALTHRTAPTATAAALEALAISAEPGLVLGVRIAQGGDRADLELARSLGVLTAPPAMIVQGRDLIALGLKPGPAMGDLLQRLFRVHQVGARIQDRDALLAIAAAELRGA